MKVLTWYIDPNGIENINTIKYPCSTSIKKGLYQSNTGTIMGGPKTFEKEAECLERYAMDRMFEVNGEPVFIRGGNWILSDGLLRLSEDRYYTDVNFHADMNLNMIRVWGGALAERPEFYSACDKRGILVNNF